MQVLYNARILTLDPTQPLATALAIENGRVVIVSHDEELLALSGKDIVRQDMGGRVIWPGLTDAHLHLDYYSLGLRKVDCETDERGECVRRVAERARQTPPGAWILGHGWNQNSWPEGFGNAADLDAAAPEHPVYLTAKSLHAGWANTRALRLSGISSSTPDPESGVIQRDERGEPTGILFESAMELVAGAIPEPSLQELSEAIDEAQQTLWQVGLTGAHDFDRRRCFAALQNLHQQGKLQLRVVKSIPVDDLPHAIAVGLRTGFGDDFLRIGPVKLFADGALGPQTAAMLQPYEGSNNLGYLMLDEEEIFETGRQASENGLSLAIHAIGDAANHAVLNGYAQLRAYEKAKGLPALRHRIEHVQLIHPEDIHRLHDLGVIASMQPIHATSDMETADRYWGKRSATSYAWQSVRQSGAVLAFGSDAPVESPNPFWGLHAAVTRRRKNGSPGPEGWITEQRLALEDALRGFTTGAAYAGGTEKQSGKLAPGCLADLIVLNRDPFGCAPEELYSLLPDATMVNGQWVWGAA